MASPVSFCLPMPVARPVKAALAASARLFPFGELGGIVAMGFEDGADLRVGAGDEEEFLRVRGVGLDDFVLGAAGALGLAVTRSGCGCRIFRHGSIPPCCGVGFTT